MIHLCKLCHCVNQPESDAQISKYYHHLTYKSQENKVLLAWPGYLQLKLTFISGSPRTMHVRLNISPPLTIFEDASIVTKGGPLGTKRETSA